MFPEVLSQTAMHDAGFFFVLFCFLFVFNFINRKAAMHNLLSIEQEDLHTQTR